METLKVTYEIKYPRILNFRDFYKPIINPYFSYPNAKYAIINEGNHQELIRLTFIDSNHYLIFTPDAISFQFDGNVNELIENGSHIEMIFEVFRKIKETGFFLKVSSEVLEISAFKEFDSNFLDVFTKKSLITSVLSAPNDLAITEEGIEKDYNCTLQYGPFAYENDIKRYNLFSLNEIKKIEYTDKDGLLINCRTHTTDLETVNKKSFNKIVGQNIELINRIIEKYD